VVMDDVKDNKKIFFVSKTSTRKKKNHLDHGAIILPARPVLECSDVSLFDI